MKKLMIALFFSAFPLSIYCQDFKIVTEDFPPYNFEENGVIKGLSTQVVLAVLKEIKEETEIEILPWARAYKYASTRENYLIYSIARTPEREFQFQWVGSIAPYRTSLYKLKTRDDIKIASLDDAKTYLIGCSFLDVITAYLQKKKFTNLYQVSNDIQNLHKLALGRLDLIAYDEASFKYKVKQEGLDVSIYERAFRLEDLSDDLYMAFSESSNPLLVKRFKEGLISIKKKGIYDVIQKRYTVD